METKNSAENMTEENIQTAEAVEKDADIRCPQCGGIMEYDPERRKMYCPYCDNTIDIADDHTHAEEQDFLSAANDESANSNTDWGMKTKTVICKSCGGENIYDAMQISGECPYCGSKQVFETANKPTMAPGGVVPFTVSRKNAGERFINWIGKRLFCPKKAKQKAKPEAFTGLYLPYWTFDTNTDTSYVARVGRDRTVRDSKGNTHTVTDWKTVYGKYKEFINDHLVCGTTRHDAKLLRGIEPFDTENNKVYTPEYLAGYASERYSVKLSDAWSTAKRQLESHIDSAIRSQARVQNHADHVNIVSKDIDFRNIKYKYLLLPIWISSFYYNGKQYSFYVNGQTGKVSGKTPVSALRVLVAILIGLGLFALLVFLFRNM